MKRFFVVTLGSIAVLFLGTQFARAQEKSFNGIVTDQDLNCIQKPMKVPAQPEHTPKWDKGACVLYWDHFANPKDKIALYDPETKAVYHFDKNDDVIPFAGDPNEVKVTGTYNDATKTITVKNVQP